MLLLGIATAVPAWADGPGADFKLDRQARIFKSPDRHVRLEQHAKTLEDGSWAYQIWTFDANHRHAFLLNPGEGDDPTGYAAGFRFSPDSQWLVRMQKVGSGTQTLFLYRRNGYQFYTGDGEAPWRSRLGLFLHDADIKGNVSGPGKRA
jgi:hypothetical protein